MKQATLFILLLITTVVMGQKQVAVTGFVIDENGKPLKDISISNTKGDIRKTNFYGSSVVHTFVGDTLTFKGLGFKTLKWVVVDLKDFSVVLKYEDQASIDEVVVTAYSPQYKKHEALAVNSLQYRVAGVAVSPSRTSNNIVLRGVAFKSNTESYKGIDENEFRSPLKEALSTFAADVDVASYNNIKRFLNFGSLPPVDAVRIEEMINYFQYDLASPKGEDPVHIKTELSVSPWNKQHQLLRISLKAKDIPKEKLPPSNFVFLVDVSGSMGAYNKLPLVKSALKLLVDQLRPQDKVAIITYAGHSQIELESVGGDHKMKIKEKIDGLEASGSTAGGDGLKMAYKMAREHFIKDGNNRIIMATDGDFNVGASSDEDMVKLIEKERESSINISILGFGMGNYKDSKLESLANKGRGNYAYINDIAEARKAVISEFGGTLFTVAKDVKIQVEFNPKNVQYYRLVGYENRLMAAEDFNNDNKVGGDMGVGHVVTAIYDIIPTGVKSSLIGTVDALKYQETEKVKIVNNSEEIATVKFRYKDPNSDQSKLQENVVSSRDLKDMSSDFQFATAVAELGMLLRNSTYQQNSNFDNLIARAQKSKGIDEEGYRAEFIKIAKNAKALMMSEK